MLTLVNNTRTNNKPNKSEIYLKAFYNALKFVCEDSNDKHKLKQSVFLGVKYINSLRDDDEYKTEHYLRYKMQLLVSVEGLMQRLTPSELLSIFPVDKTYDGEKNGWKDYFYTMTEINKLNPNEAIGENLHDLLWDYQNTDISDFLVSMLSTTSDLMRLNGQKGIAEQFCMDNDIPMYYEHEDNKGKKFLMDSNGRTMKIKRKIPRYLKAVN